MREFLRLPNAITSATAQRRKRHAQRIRRVPQERMPRVTGEKGRAVEAVNIVFNSQQKSDRQNHGRMVANTKMTKEQLMFLRMVEWNLEARLRVVQF